MEVITKKIVPNEAQQRCIDNTDGIVLVLAGPGTGKTFTIVHRISKMLEKGIEPNKILCLTFSDAAASEMRHRVIKKVGVVAASINIYTYHSFCNEILKEYPEEFALSLEVKLITETIKRELMIKAIDECDPKYFVAERGGKYFHIGTILNSIEKIKSKRISRNDYFNAISENPQLIPAKNALELEISEREAAGNTKNTTRYKDLEKINTNIEKAKELWKIYECYSSYMVQEGYIDFADMINLVIEKFQEDSTFLKEISEKYDYLLVDEYQDTNDLQNNILFSILSQKKSPNVFVVGDDDQIIYGFQGANSENIENFLNKYPDTEVICLTENNRSTQTILDMSYKLLNQDKLRLEANPMFKNYKITKSLTAKNEEIIKKDQKISRWQFGDVSQEYNYIVEDIVSKINQNPDMILSQIAIISKKKKELRTFSELFKAKNIPVQLGEGANIFGIKSSLSLYFYLKALNNQELCSDKLFGLLLTPPFQISLKDYNKLLQEHKRQCSENNDFITNMEKLSDWSDELKIRNFLKNFNYLKTYSSTNNLRNTVIEVLNRTGIIEYFFKTPDNRLENILAIKKMIDEATDLMDVDPSATVNDFINKLDYCKENNIEINTEKSDVVQNAIQLVTYHASKGREFEYVYLPNLLSSNWEKFKNPSEYKLVTDYTLLENDILEDKKDSELIKQLFVGITRAKYSLTLSHSENENGKIKTVTKYLDCLKDFDFDYKIFEYDENDSIQEFYKSISREATDNRMFLSQELKNRVENIVLSPSSVNAYKTCPRQFLYSNVIGININEGNRDSANYGLIIHNILECSAKEFLKGKEYFPKEKVIEIFKKKLDSEVFSSKDKKQTYLHRGLSVFENYYKHFCETPKSMLYNVEEKFDGVDFSGEMLNGKIDRIEKLSDGTYALYDYKTSSPISKTQFKIGGIKEDYFNQLCCYKYAFEKKTGYKVSKVGIIYVEHNKDVVLELTSEDMEHIENLIIEIYKNIRELKFDVPESINEKTCEYCDYKDLCKMDII